MVEIPSCTRQSIRKMTSRLLGRLKKAAFAFRQLATPQGAVIQLADDIDALAVDLRPFHHQPKCALLVRNPDGIELRCRGTGVGPLQDNVRDVELDPAAAIVRPTI
jgi:hypothetical protein